MARAVTVLRGGTVGRIIELPIDLLAQSAALFCPYRFHKFNGASGYGFAGRYRRADNRIAD